MKPGINHHADRFIPAEREAVRLKSVSYSDLAPLMILVDEPAELVLLSSFMKDV